MLQKASKYRANLNSASLKKKLDQLISQKACLRTRARFLLFILMKNSRVMLKGS